MLQARPLQQPEIIVVGMIGRQKWPEDGDQRQQRDDDKTDDRLATGARLGTRSSVAAPR
jgi:hypothetical protein